MSKHLIMGTAGHVDHGKTALIKSLTGFDCDTHKQEKERGITINLGFSHLMLSAEKSVGIIDVPGHIDFIKNMIAGACGIDFVLLVISADEGVMPQTREHFEIMKILDTKKGIVVLTKVDLVDKEMIELAEEEIREFTFNSFLENAPFIRFSSETKAGLPELREVIEEIFDQIKPRSSQGNFRLYIDRIFKKQGFGTIVNGSVLSGNVNRNEDIYILPIDKKVKIRSIQRHGKEVEQVYAGDRASFNLSGFRYKDFRKGMVLSKRIIKATSLLDVKLKLFPQAPELNLWNQVIFLHETNREMVRLHLLDKNVLNENEIALAQIYLSEPIIAQYGDKFVIRNSSGTITLGGGEIIDPYPLHHRRRRKKQVELVQNKASGDLKKIVTAEILKSVFPLTLAEIAGKTGLSSQQISKEIINDLPEQIIVYNLKNEHLFISRQINDVWKKRIIRKLSDFHKKNPLLNDGLTLNELQSIFETEINEKLKQVLDFILNELIYEKKIFRTKTGWKSASHRVLIDNTLKEKIASVLNIILKAKFNFSEYSRILEKTELPNGELNQILAYLRENRQIIYIHPKYVHREIYQEMLTLLTGFLKKYPNGISVAQFRDLLSGNRSNTILILEHFDSSGITIRKGNLRLLTRKYQESIEE